VNRKKYIYSILDPSGNLITVLILGIEEAEAFSLNHSNRHEEP
jgi:hypothetical protein